MDELSAASLACLRCKGPMEQGFVPDRGESSVVGTQIWMAGQPEHSIWTGIKLKGKQAIPVTTFRCTMCGYLESHAVLPKP
ncbi:hypothetical protein BH09GEM1_BH09GEM1_10280 [soil metagenome]